MRRAVVVGILALTGCTKATVIGTLCTKDKDCNIKGQLCVAGVDGARICTHGCAGQAGPTGCPIGYDCTVTDANLGFTCNQEKFAFDSTTGEPLLFGKDCSLDDSVCQSTGDPNPNPACRHALDITHRPPQPLKQDPHAFCSGSCGLDSDCPVNMECIDDYDGQKKCLRRTFCSPCVVNDNCPGEFSACVPTKDGQSHYCSKPCGGNGDCGGAVGTFLSCAQASDASGQAGQFCLHKYGQCVGTGQVCDPCRTDADCAATQTTCLLNLSTGERMCTKSCTTDGECASPNATGCDFGPDPVNPGDPIYTDLCTGDPMHLSPGTFTCFL